MLPFNITSKTVLHELYHRNISVCVKLLHVAKKSFLIKFPTHNYSNLGLLKFNIFVIIPHWVKLRVAKMVGSLHIHICKILIFHILHLSNLLVLYQYPVEIQTYRLYHQVHCVIKEIYNVTITYQLMSPMKKNLSLVCIKGI